MYSYKMKTVCCTVQQQEQDVRHQILPKTISSSENFVHFSFSSVNLHAEKAKASLKSFYVRT
jgi:hypothetical protein